MTTQNYSYNDNQASHIPMQTPELQSIMERFAKQNSEYNSTLQGISEKMHKIYSIEQKTSDNQNEKRPPSNDFTSAMHEQLDYMSQYNNRLQQVLDHIQKIIG